MTALLRGGAFDPWQELAHIEAGLAKTAHGAYASFVGTMRDFNAGDRVEHTSGNRDTNCIIDECKEEILSDVAHGSSSQFCAACDTAQIAPQ